MIWDPHLASSRAACSELRDKWKEILPNHLNLAMGEPDRGHNFMLLGSKEGDLPDCSEAEAKLIAAGVPIPIMKSIHCKD
jgi:hypothetical protein